MILADSFCISGFWSVRSVAFAPLFFTPVLLGATLTLRFGALVPAKDVNGGWRESER